VSRPSPNSQEALDQALADAIAHDDVLDERRERRASAAARIRPHPDCQAGRILCLLESAHGAKVPLPKILDLKISQYGARIHTLRHEYGFAGENGHEEGRPGHTWFRLVDGPRTRLEMAATKSIARHDKPQTTGEPEQASLFPDRTERHLDLE
jgi:hypothetical protein